MHRIVKNAQKGFTLIELMIVVAIIGILAAIAIPQFLDMMKSSKKTEAEVNLDAIKKAEKAYIPEHGGFVVGDSSTLPANPGDSCCDSGRSDRKCDVDVSAFSGDDVWNALQFTIDEPNYFNYTYSGTSSDFTATADGDLDCDTDHGTYTLTGSIAAGNGGYAAYSLTAPTRAK